MWLGHSLDACSGDLTLGQGAAMFFKIFIVVPPEFASSSG
jgi:hypothetical protein